MFPRILLMLVVVGLLPSAAGAQPPKPTKKLIEFGWDEPDVAFLKRHLAEMEKTPFDGTVFHLPGEYLWNCWGKKKLSEAEVAGAIEDLRRLPLKRFTHNFLRFNVTPGDVDWFDDFAPVIANARLAAKAAKAGRAAGILFDIEQYTGQPFNYSKQRDGKTKNWDAYAAQARLRGREVMGAFQQEFSNVVILTTWSHSLPHLQAKGDSAKLPQTGYGLLKPFLDGMFDAASGGTKIVDGYESSYGYRNAEQFDAVRKRMKETVLSWLPERDRYLRHSSQGFGIWLDNDWRKKGWSEIEVAKNYFTPEQFEASVKSALATSDEYVWIYTEKPRWWTEPAGKPAALPAAYDRALRRAAGREAPK